MAFLRRTACGRSSGRALNVAADRAAHCMSSPLGPRTTPRGCSGRARHVAAAQRNCPRRPPTLRALSFPPRVQSIASAASARCGRPSRPATSGRSCRARASARRRRPAQASPHAPRRESTRQMVLAPAAPRPPLGPAVTLPLVISTPLHHHPSPPRTAMEAPASRRTRPSTRGAHGPPAASRHADRRRFRRGGQRAGRPADGRRRLAGRPPCRFWSRSAQHYRGARPEQQKAHALSGAARRARLGSWVGGRRRGGAVAAAAASARGVVHGEMFPLVRSDTGNRLNC